MNSIWCWAPRAVPATWCRTCQNTAVDTKSCSNYSCNPTPWTTPELAELHLCWQETLPACLPAWSMEPFFCSKRTPGCPAKPILSWGSGSHRFLETHTVRFNAPWTKRLGAAYGKEKHPKPNKTPVIVKHVLYIIKVHFRFYSLHYNRAFQRSL